MGLIDRAKGVVNSFMNSHDQIDRAKAEDVVEKLKKEHNESVKHRKNNLENEYKSNKLAIVKDVAHKALSDFLYPKFLEGNVGSRSIHSFLKDLAALPQHIKDKDGNDINITKIQDAFNNALDIQLNMEEIQVRKETTKFEQAQKTVLTHSLANEIALDIQKLPVGETMMMPGGTRTHAMLYEFTRTSSDKLTLKVHNPGDGIINHVKNPSSIKWSGPIKAGSLTIKDIDQMPLMQVLSKNLLTLLSIKKKQKLKVLPLKYKVLLKVYFLKKFLSIKRLIKSIEILIKSWSKLEGEKKFSKKILLNSTLNKKSGFALVKFFLFG